MLSNNKQMITMENSQLVKFKRYAELSDSYWWFSGMRYILNGLMERYGISCCTAAARYLDLGCGSGASLSRESTIGIDVSTDAILVCRQHKNNRLLQAEAESLPFKEKSFDVITAEGVIEHILFDNALLDEAFRVSKNNGYLLVLTSAYNFLWSHHDVASGHHRRYTRQKLKDVIEKSGFHILKITYINSFLFPLIAAIRFLQKIIGMDNSSDKEDLISIPGPLNYILTGILYLESLIIRVYSFPAGVSLACLAQKKT